MKPTNKLRWVMRHCGSFDSKYPAILISGTNLVQVLQQLEESGWVDVPLEGEIRETLEKQSGTQKAPENSHFKGTKNDPSN